MDIPFSFARGLPFTDEFLANNTSAAVSCYIGQATANFTLPSESGTNTYLVRYTVSKSFIRCNDKTIYTNRTISGQNLTECFRPTGQIGGYLPHSYTETIANNPVINSGTVNLYNTIVKGNLRSNSIPGAYMNAFVLFEPVNLIYHVPVYRNVPNYGTYYQDDIAASLQSYDKRDNFYTVCPGYRLVVYNDYNYNGTITLDYENNTTRMQTVKPTSVATGSSCKLYFHGELIL